MRTQRSFFPLLLPQTLHHLHGDAAAALDLVLRGTQPGSPFSANSEKRGGTAADVKIDALARRSAPQIL